MINVREEAIRKMNGMPRMDGMDKMLMRDGWTRVPADYIADNVADLANNGVPEKSKIYLQKADLRLSNGDLHLDDAFEIELQDATGKLGVLVHPDQNWLKGMRELDSAVNPNALKMREYFESAKDGDRMHHLILEKLRKGYFGLADFQDTEYPNPNYGKTITQRFAELI